MGGSYFTPVRMVDIIKASDRSCWLGSEEKKNHLFLVCRSAKLYSHCGNEAGSSHESLKLIYFEIEIYHFGAYTQKNVYLTTEILDRLCLMLFSS